MMTESRHAFRRYCLRLDSIEPFECHGPSVCAAAWARGATGDVDSRADASRRGGLLGCGQSGGRRRFGMTGASGILFL